MYKLRKTVIRLTGYWIYKKKHLTTGVDFLIDIANHFPDEFREMKTILDVGANSGQSAIRFAEELPKSRIYSFEPHPETYSTLEKNTGQLAQVTCFAFGLGEKAELKELHLGKFSAWNSMQPDVNTVNKTLLVEVKTLDQVARELKLGSVDLLKTDTEGHDLYVLKGGQELLSNGNVSFIYVEAGFYNTNPRNTQLTELIPYLKQFGYYLFGIYEVSKGGSQMVNGNALFVHESLVKHTYEIG